MTGLITSRTTTTIIDDMFAAVTHSTAHIGFANVLRGILQSGCSAVMALTAYVQRHSISSMFHGRVADSVRVPFNVYWDSGRKSALRILRRARRHCGGIVGFKNSHRMHTYDRINSNSGNGSSNRSMVAREKRSASYRVWFERIHHPINWLSTQQSTDRKSCVQERCG